MNLLIALPPLFSIRFGLGIVCMCCCLFAHGQHTSNLASIWNSSLAPPAKLDSMSHMLHKAIPTDSLEKYAHQVILLSQALQTPLEQAKRLKKLGDLALQEHQNPSLAENYYRQAFVLRKQTGKVAYPAYLADKIGSMAYTQGRYLAAIDMYREVIGLYRKNPVKYRKNLSIASLNQGMNFQKLWMLDSALYYFDEALTLKKNEGDTSGLINVYNELAKTYRNRQDLTTAQNYLDSAAKILQKQESSQTALMADNHLLQASLLQESSRYEEAISHIRQANRIYQSLGEEKNMAKAMNNIGKSYIQMQEYDQAVLALNAAEDLVTDTLSSDLLAIIYRNLSDAHRYQRKYGQALAYSKKCQDAFDLFQESSKGKGDFITKLEQRFLVENNNNLAESHSLYLLNRRQRRQFFLALTAAFLIILLSLWGFWQAKNNHRKTKQVLSLNQELHNQKILHIVKDREDELATAFIEGQDKEREHIAAELHDNLAGSIAACKNLVGMLPSADESSSSHKLHSKVIQILDSVYQHTRLLSHQLTHSTQQYSFGDLSREVEDLLENLRMLNIEVDLQIKGDIKDQINTLSAFHLKRIVQEAITNIIKYAQASSVQFYLDWQSDYLNMTIEDDGIGFDPKNTEEGIGIQNMTMRVKRLHGDIQMYSSPQNGTRTELKVPKNMMEFAYH